MRHLFKPILDYASAHTSPLDSVLQELERETFLKILSPQMVAGSLQGALLRFISQWLKPQRVLEVGTFTGYSAICFASQMPDNALLHTIELNEELEYMILKYVEKAGLSDKVKLHIGDAKKIIPLLDEKFDLVYLDADKQAYSYYYDLIFDKINIGGYLLADNVLWSGKVLAPEKSKDAVALDLFNKKVQNDSRVTNILLPIDDGLMIAQKLSV